GVRCSVDPVHPADRSGSGHCERERRCNRARPSARLFGRTDRDHARARAEAPRRRPRPRLDVHRRRSGHRHHRGGRRMSDEKIVIERDATVGWIRINRPERLNAFAGTMRTDLRDALIELEQDPDVRCVIITGVGRAFSTGGDINVMSEIIAANDRDRFEKLVRAGADVVKQLDIMTEPVIAAIHGAAAGAGACLALACDLRIASETASIGFTFLRVGLHPDWGGSYFLPRLIGPAAAAEFIYTGGMISAERGERLGLFNRVVPAAQLESA